MRKSDLGSSQPGAYPRKRRDEWPAAPVRPVRSPVTNTRRALPRRSVR